MLHIAGVDRVAHWGSRQQRYGRRRPRCGGWTGWTWRVRATDIARKQWVNVAEAIQDPADALIVAGYPALDPELRGIAVFTLSVTTKKPQMPKHRP